MAEEKGACVAVAVVPILPLTKGDGPSVRSDMNEAAAVAPKRRWTKTKRSSDIVTRGEGSETAGRVFRPVDSLPTPHVAQCPVMTQPILYPTPRRDETAVECEIRVQVELDSHMAEAIAEDLASTMETRIFLDPVPGPLLWIRRAEEVEEREVADVSPATSVSEVNTRGSDNNVDVFKGSAKEVCAEF